MSIYYVLNRGDRRKAIFKDNQGRERFLITLGEACHRADWQARAYRQMNSHFHPVIETPQLNLAAEVKRLLARA